MKSKNFSKDYLLYIIRFLTGKIIDCEHSIRRYDILIEKEKKTLNNAKLSHETLWTHRYERTRNISAKRIYQNELKNYQKIFSQKF